MSFDNELTRFEEKLAMQFRGHNPDGIFVEDLKSRLKNSEVFKLRREIGAILVASLSVLLAGTLAGLIGEAIVNAKKKQP